ncbi:MAG: hypothetical protein IPP35_12070 [Elusimicrobia bacterium]|nr:hypothetical protein [Elusimicrobiota bacterium]
MKTTPFSSMAGGTRRNTPDGPHRVSASSGETNPSKAEGKLSEGPSVAAIGVKRSG